MRGRKKFIIGGILIIIAIALLIFLGLKSSATYYYEVKELLARGSSLAGKTVRVEGVVAPGVVHEAGTFRFKIIDTASQNITLPVVYQGLAPDTFQVGRPIVAEGNYIPGEAFQAISIITRCPSKYQPEETRGN